MAQQPVAVTGDFCAGPAPTLRSSTRHHVFLSLLLASSTLLLTSHAHAKTILVLGDSISAAYGMAPEQGWVARLQTQLDSQKPKQHRLINASISGETTSGGLARLPALLKTHKPDIVVIELGGNDGLRGQPPQLMSQNLGQMIQLVQTSKAQPVLFGMKIPPNYGAAYTNAFEQSYQTVATHYRVPLLPFFLEGIGGNSALMQADRIHPNPAGQPILLTNAWTVLKPLLQDNTPRNKAPAHGKKPSAPSRQHE